MAVLERNGQVFVRDYRNRPIKIISGPASRCMRISIVAMSCAGLAQTQ